MRVGVFGGTFDPPHVGHQILAAECLFQLVLDRLLWVLTPVPPHKPDQPVTPVEMRLELLQAALDDNPSFQLSTIEIDRPPPHYAFETLLLLRRQFPSAHLAYLMGGDSLHDLPGWRQPAEFIAASDSIGVMRRPGDNIDLTALEKRFPGLSSKVEFVEAPLLEISATEIRRRAALGQPFRYYLPPKVYQIIEERQLYRTSDRFLKG